MAMGGADLTGAPRCPGDGNRWGGPWRLRWGPALRGGGEGCAATGRDGLDGSDRIAHREGGSTAARAQRIQAPVKETLHCRSGEVRLYRELLRGLQTRQGRGWSVLSMVTVR
jgi:hypothetical protein